MFAELGITTGLVFTHVLEMRYVGQAFEVSVSFDTPEMATLDEATLRSSFDAAHHRIFEFAESSANRVEIVSFRLGASVPPESLPSLHASEPDTRPGSTQLFDRGQGVGAQLLNRLHLDATPRAGPLLIEDETSTIYVPDGWAACLDEHQNLIITSGGAYK